MGTDFLEAFLDGLPEGFPFDEDTYDLGDVRVDEQVPVWEGEKTEDDSTPGYLDLVLDVPNEWFALVELKFSAEESGTESYCRTERIGDERVEDYGSGTYYLYIHQSDQPEATGKCFESWTWVSFLDDVLA